MALFKIFKGNNTAKITNSSATGYITPTDGYAYYDTGSKLFYIDAAYSGTTISRQPINADNATNGIFYGTCTTAQATQAKVATLTNGTGFSLKAGTIVAIKFTYASGASTMTLNVNNTGAKNLYQYGTTLMSSGTTTTGWPAGAVVPFVYDGTYWFRLYWNNTVTTVTTTGTGNAITAISASNGAITATKGTTFLTSHQDISGKADKSATVSTLTWDSTNKKITKTINGSTSDVVQFAAGGNIALTGAAGKLTIEAIDTKVTQNNTIADNDYRVLLSASANDTIETSNVNKSINLQYNPSTNLLKTGNISGSGDLTITGNANLNGETYAESITAGSLLVNGNTNFVQSPTAPTPEATSNDTTIATTAFVKSAFTENDAMIFKGTINANGDLPATHKQGWAYRVGTATSYAGKTCEVGDIIVCIADGTAANNDHWTVIQNNINGPIYRETNTFTDKNVIIADGTAGKVKSSGVTITTATPAASSTSATIPTSNAVWSAITGASGYGKTGTVTGVQVQATSPVVSSTSGNATTSLNTTISLANAYGDTKNPYGTKTANYVLAGPTSSNAAAPTFRKLVADDIPSLTKSKISDFPTSMPASDVSAWAKAASKPTYTASEVGAAAASHTHGNITNDGKITTTATIASGDKLVIVDSDSTAGSKITGSSITFDGSTTTKALTQKGTWETFLQSHQSLAAYAPLASPALTGTPTAPTPAATSNDTTIATTAFVMNAFTANDAMVFKGVVNANGDLPATHKQGWTYRVATAGTYAGKVCEVGDMIICVTDGTAATDAHWAVIQNNVDGAVYRGTNAFTDANIIVADSTNGKVKSSGKTITTTAPSSSAANTTIPTSKAVWSAISGASGYGKTGTVTGVQVKATAPIVSSTSGNATTSLNTTISLAATSANYVIAGPTSGTATAVPTYRKLVAADIPSLTKSKISDFPTNVSAFTNDSGYLTSFTETDPTVPTWAKAASKPSYTASEVGLGNVTNAAQITKSTFTKAYQVMYSTAANAPAVLDANTATTKKFLRMTGTGSAGAAPAWDTVSKSDVGLGNVENTKLSTWAGSTAITTLGTISTGTIPWARLSDIPTSFAPSSHTHGNLTNDGKITTTATIASGDKLVIVDSDSTAGSKITGSSITFGTSTATFLSNNGTWVTPPGTYSLPLAASGTRGGIKIGYSESGNNYAVKLSSEKAYVTVPWTDTKNTAGSTDTTSKIFLIGATSQAANPQTYSDSEIYVQNGTLYAVKTQDLSGTANNKPALIIGGTDTAAHMEFDANEIQAKTNGTSVSQLYINNDGGLVTVGSGGLAITSLTASQAVSTDANKKLVSTNLTVSDPTASGTGITYIATISQSATGKITATKSTVRSASTSQTGVTQYTEANTNTQLSTLTTTWTATPTDDTLFIRRDTGGGATFGQVKFSTLWNYIKGKITAGTYWANIKISDAAKYNAAPEMATLKLNGNTSATAASTSNVMLVYDSTNQALNFVFA